MREDNNPQEQSVEEIAQEICWEPENNRSCTWAYDAMVKALTAERKRAEEAEQSNRELREALERTIGFINFVDGINELAEEDLPPDPLKAEVLQIAKAALTPKPEEGGK